MVRAASLRRARERIEIAGRAGLAAVPLRQQVLEALRPVVPFDACVWVLTDPMTTVGVAPYADIPPAAFAGLSRLIRSRYTTASGRWTHLLPLPSPVAVFDLRDGERDDGSEWPRCLSEYGIESVASMVHADPFGCWAFLDLWRSGAPFTREEAGSLASLATAITTALRGCQSRTFAAPPTSARVEVGPVVLTLDDDLEILNRTSSSQAWLDRLLPADPGAAVVPASVLNAASQLLATEQGVDDHPPMARTHLADGVWLCVRAARIAGSPGRVVDHPPSAGSIVVTIDECSAADRLDLFCRAYGLSIRESQLVSLLASGSDTRLMARRMGVAELTIQDHLKSVFAKTAAHDRLGVVSRAVGTRAGVPS